MQSSPYSKPEVKLTPEERKLLSRSANVLDKRRDELGQCVIYASGVADREMKKRNIIPDRQLSTVQEKEPEIAQPQSVEPEIIIKERETDSSDQPIASIEDNIELIRKIVDSSYDAPDAA